VFPLALLGVAPVLFGGEELQNFDSFLGVRSFNDAAFAVGNLNHDNDNALKRHIITLASVSQALFRLFLR
jgi:hypothetical protein